MGHVMVAFKRNLELEPEATCSTNMVHSLLQRNIHLQSCNFPFHYATRSSLVKSAGSDQFGFVFFVDTRRLLLCPRCRRE